MSDYNEATALNGVRCVFAGTTDGTNEGVLALAIPDAVFVSASAGGEMDRAMGLVTEAFKILAQVQPVAIVASESE